jgi:hypothetical protein
MFMHNIFLSYSRKDTEIMQRVKQSFRAAGLIVWTDEGIEPGTSSWKRAIEHALMNTQCLVCLASPESKKSEWVQEELDFAALHEKPRFLVLVHGEPKNAIPFGFSSHQFTDIRQENNYEEQLNRLIGTIRQKIDTNKPPISGKANVLLPPPFDWCAIPAGKVTIKGKEVSYIPEGTEQTFELPAFLIAKYPVSNAQYRLFLEDAGYQNQAWWTTEGWRAKEKDKWIEPRYWHDQDFNGAEQPVVGISWYESIAFCSWLSARSGDEIMLPSEQQWQRAAQGDDGRSYPWGNDFDKTKANTVDSAIGKTTVVTAYPNGVSPYGLMDMVGNAYEWCQTSYRLQSSSKIMRGGCFEHRSSAASCFFRGYSNPAYAHSYYGFRIAKAL